jgi:hypothetical protein
MAIINDACGHQTLSRHLCSMPAYNAAGKSPAFMVSGGSVSAPVPGFTCMLGYAGRLKLTP